MPEHEELTDARVREHEKDGYVVLTERRIFASISKLAALTGRDRHTVSDRLRELQYRRGPKNAALYPVDLALRLIFKDG